LHSHVIQKTLGKDYRKLQQNGSATETVDSKTMTQHQLCKHHRDANTHMGLQSFCSACLYF